MKKYSYLIQDEPYSCGAYCIMMILKYLHIEEEIDEVKKHCQMDAMGISMLGLVECLKHYHIEAGGYEVDVDHLKKGLDYPAILHVQKEGLWHYIVFYEYKAPYFICADPAIGKVKYTRAELERIYTNKAVVVTFVSKPIPTKYLSFDRFMLEKLKLYKKEVFQLSLCSLMITLTVTWIQFYFRYLMDWFYHPGKVSIFILMSFVAVSMVLQKAYYQKRSDRLFIQLERHLYRDMIYKTLNHLLDLPSGYYQRYVRNEHVSKLQSLYELPYFIVSLWQRLEFDLIMVMVLLTVILLVDRILFYSILPFFILMMLVSYIYMKRLYQQDTHLLNHYSALNEEAFDHIYHQQDYHSFDLVAIEKEYQQERYDHFETTYFNKKDNVYKYQRLLDVLFQMMSVYLFLIGSIMMHYEWITLGEWVMSYTLISYLIEPMLKILEVGLERKRMQLIFERYKAFQVESESFPLCLEEPIQSVAFENVTFSFGYRAPIFAHVNALFMHHYIVKGKNGSGKSTFLKLLAGHYPYYQGQILINQRDLKEMSKKERESKICYLSQEAFIKNRTVYEFLTGGDKGKETRLYKLVQKYHLEEINAMIVKGFDQHGEGLSQGQKQFVAFLRVLLLNYEVYVFDEAFSHMNDALKEKVYAMIKGDDFKNKIVFIVDHQINKMAKSKSYVIIEKGTITIENQEE